MPWKMYFFTLRTTTTNLIKRSLIHARNYSYVHTTPKPLTSCEELHHQLQQPKWHQELRIIDARCDMVERDFFALHMEKRISGSKFLSFDECCDQSTTLPFMLPSSTDFSAYVTRLGISNQHHVVIYDHHELVGALYSPRVWWMFRAFGHDKVSILDGGFGKWLSDGYPSVSGAYTEQENLPKPSEPFKAIDEPKYYVNFESMIRNVESNNPIQLVDTRLEDMFSAGHIPGSNITPFTEYFNQDKTMKSKEDLIRMFHSNKVDIESDMIATCEIGVTAAIAAHALFYTKGRAIPVYDGSFTEWKHRAPDNISRDD